MKGVCIFIMSAFFVANVSSADFKYEHVFRAESSRIGDVVVRYIKTLSGACLYIEALQYSTWEVVSEKALCSFEGKDFMNEVSDASFEDIHFSRDGVHMVLAITPLFTGEVRRKCIFPVIKGNIEDLVCGTPIVP